MNHPQTSELRLILLVLAGVVLFCASRVLLSWKGSEMDKPGFDSPEGNLRGTEDAVAPYPGVTEAAHASTVKDKHEVRLMAMDGVEGVGLGRTALGDDAIVVYVRDQQAAERLPKELDGVAVQLQVTGRIDAQKRK